MSVALVPVITRAGLAAVRNAQGTGLLATIVSMAVGRGNPDGSSFKGYAPSGNATALVSEQARVPLLSGSQLGGVAGSDPIGFRVLSVVPASSPGNYPINEVGFYLADGTLLALWSDPAFPIAFKTSVADTELAFDLFLDALPTASLAITVIEADVPDTSGVLAQLLRGVTINTMELISTNERLTLRGL